MPFLMFCTMAEEYGLFIIKAVASSGGKSIRPNAPVTSSNLSPIAKQLLGAFSSHLCHQSIFVLFKLLIRRLLDLLGRATTKAPSTVSIRRT